MKQACTVTLKCSGPYGKEQTYKTNLSGLENVKTLVKSVDIHCKTFCECHWGIQKNAIMDGKKK